MTSVSPQVWKALLHASVAQLAEQLICNQQVAGSSPAAGSSGASPEAR
jgi:hypothetical protein